MFHVFTKHPWPLSNVLCFFRNYSLSLISMVWCLLTFACLFPVFLHSFILPWQFIQLTLSSSSSFFSSRTLLLICCRSNIHKMQHDRIHPTQMYIIHAFMFNRLVSKVTIASYLVYHQLQPDIISIILIYCFLVSASSKEFPYIHLKN